MLNSSENTPIVKSLFGKPIELTNYSQSLIRLRAYQDSNTFTLYSDIYFPKKATFLLLEAPNQPTPGLIGPTFTIGAPFNDTYQFLFSDVISPTTTEGANELLNILYGWLGLVSGISINGGSTNGLLNTINLIPGTNITINGVSDPINNQYDITISSTGSAGTVTSVGLAVPSPANPAFSVTPGTSPVTTSGTLTIQANGLVDQYVRGDGSLANFPFNPGGGSSVSYYCNGSVNQGVIGGNTYYQLSKTANTGPAANFTINTDGYIAQFITNAGDPALLNIPAGNWDFQMYFSASSAGGNPRFYTELYKYTGITLTLIASGSLAPQNITNGTFPDVYVSTLAIPATTLTLTDRLAIRVYVIHSGRTITMYTQDSRLAEIHTTFSTGILALNGLTSQVQHFAVGSSGTDFNIVSSVDTHTFNIPTASASSRGALSSSDYVAFSGSVGVTKGFVMAMAVAL